MTVEEVGSIGAGGEKHRVESFGRDGERKTFI
jgi:hypothetical protein